jgi:hypothetical protein
MTKNHHGLIVVASVLAIGFGVYYITSRTSRAMAKQIVKLGGAKNWITISTFDKGFLASWLKKLRKGEDAFAYQGKSYNTIGGMAVKS